ncbi:PREDICTED: cytochrome b-c1 complex subunit 8 [Prunus dulcis]|uniref:PREDICTED: cytochrome b-c1 complex subunit 8 n=1 Tax=Prunus dulcis TaxID=3755 RepID=A0A5E4EFQ4_PRUDU|nr:PREDICTED: cytochrome b-c1 complex subunit 8 [Prunus dulcis]
MGKHPVQMRAVVYSLSPFQQKVMPGLWKDFTGKIHHKVSENWLSATLLLAPLVATYTYVQQYQEKEKLEHRFLKLIYKFKLHNKLRVQALFHSSAFKCVVDNECMLFVIDEQNIPRVKFRCRFDARCLVLCW